MQNLLVDNIFLYFLYVQTKYFCRLPCSFGTLLGLVVHYC